MTGYVMTVVAHEDDDLLFVNPDIQAAVSAGLPSATVYVTAGQLSGNGSTPGDRARNRQLGAMAAHAQMAGVASPQWAGEILWVAGRQVEHYTLTNAAAPVEVVFCNLPDGGMSTVTGGGTVTTVLVTGGLVTRTFTYAKADVLNLLAGLMARYQPTMLRHQDPLPDSRYTADHADHIAVATLAGQTANGYSDSLVVTPYRDYNIQDAPADLPPADRAAKQATYNAYAAYDSGPYQSGWVNSMYRRWPRGATWTVYDAAGALRVFAVRSGVIWTWTQGPAGWSAPVALDRSVGALAPSITVAPNADGRLQLVARRLSDHHYVTISQTTTGGWNAWYDFGSPNSGYSNADQVGVPLLVRGGDGCLRLFVKNGGGGVSMLPQAVANGRWSSSWPDLGGSGVQDGLTAAVNPDGCIELLANTMTGILHWYQDTPSGPMTANPAFPGGSPASPPVAVLMPDGTVAAAYRAAGTGEITLNLQNAPAGTWASPVVAAGRPGPGAPAVAAPAGTTHQPMLASRTADGGISVGVMVSGAWAWTGLPGGPWLDAPAMVTDPSGVVTLVAVGMDGRFCTCTQTGPGAGQPFGPWQALPS